MSAAFLRPGGRPLVLGHRGASADFPENTIAAFVAALAQGADGVELDVMRCGSGEVVVVHDDDLRRVTGGRSGLRVREAPLAALQEPDLGGGERVPTLAQVLAALPETALVNVELKSPEPPPGLAGVRAYVGLAFDDGLAAAVAQVLALAGRLSPWGDEGTTTLVSSFDPFQLWRFQQLVGDALPLGYLFESGQAKPLREAWPARVLGPAALHPEAGLCSREAVARWRKRGYALHAWTVDEPTEIAALCGLGIDGLISNRPGATRRLVG